MRDAAGASRAVRRARPALHRIATVGVLWGLALAAASAGAGQASSASGLLQPLTAVPGDVERGRSLVADRRVGLCLLCHAAPLPHPESHGTLAPPLAGVGGRLSVPQLRLRIVDSRLLHPDSVMPAYHRTTGLNQVAAERDGLPIFTAQQVEDVVAYLATLR